MDMWTGAAAINAMCVGKYGRAGFALAKGGLRITLDRASRRLISNTTAIDK